MTSRGVLLTPEAGGRGLPSQNRYSLVVAWDLRDGSSCTPKNAADNRLLQMYVPLHYHSISVSEDYKLGQPTLTCLPSLGCSARTVQAGYAICDWHKHKVAWCPSCEKHKYSARWVNGLCEPCHNHSRTVNAATSKDQHSAGVS